MSKTFKVGDHVRWNSEAGYVSGHIEKVHTATRRTKAMSAIAALATRNMK